jgi:hypothetical protein
VRERVGETRGFKVGLNSLEDIGGAPRETREELDKELKRVGSAFRIEEIDSNEWDPLSVNNISYDSKQKKF